MVYGDFEVFLFSFGGILGCVWFLVVFVIVVFWFFFPLHQVVALYLGSA